MPARIPGVAHVIQNPGMFADNALRTIGMATPLGLFPVFTGDGRSAPVSTEDIAECAVALLAVPEPHAGKSYRPTGPTVLSGGDRAAEVARTTGRRVRAVNLPFRMLLKVARMDGVNPHDALSWRHFVRVHRAGAFEARASVTDLVPRLAGRPAEDFATIARRSGARAPARRRPTNMARMLARMAILPLVPRLDIDAHACALGFPAPPAPRLSAEDAGWRAAHGLPRLAAAE